MSRILLTGGTGRLGRAIQLCTSVEAPSHAELDVTSAASCEQAIRKYDPEIVIHAAVLADAVACERNQSRAWDVNKDGTEKLISAAHGRRFVLISTDYVFGGFAANSTEGDSAIPVNVYGASKRAAELIVEKFPRALIIRAPFRARPWPYPRAFSDMWTSCRWVDEVAVDVIRAANMLDLTGIIHIGGPRRSILEMAREVSPNVGEMTRAEFPDVQLPRDCSLDSSKWHSILAAYTASFQRAETLTTASR